jgi:FHS family L-fucose permease-like MFS transporter
MWGQKEEPELKEVFNQRRPSAVEAMSNTHRKSVSNRGLTGASALTVRQSIFPITLVTILFFLWGAFCTYYLEKDRNANTRAF